MSIKHALEVSIFNVFTTLNKRSGLGTVVVFLIVRRWGVVVIRKSLLGLVDDCVVLLERQYPGDTLITLIK